MAAVMLGAAAFWHANGIILRTAHYWGDIPYVPRLLLGADVVQTAFAVFWGLTGLIGMAGPLAEARVGHGLAQRR